MSLFILRPVDFFPYVLQPVALLLRFVLFPLLLCLFVMVEFVFGRLLLFLILCIPPLLFGLFFFSALF